jgi:hypothetical protein
MNQHQYILNIAVKDYDKLIDMLNKGVEGLDEDGHRYGCSYGQACGKDDFIKECDCHPWGSCPDVIMTVNGKQIALCVCKDPEMWERWKGAAQK